MLPEEVAFATLYPSGTIKGFSVEIDPGRINDPTSLSSHSIAEKLRTRGKLVIQFSQPSAYPPNLLRKLNDICRQSTDKLEVRFYGHYWSNFDAANLRHLPHVKNLSMDCLMTISNEEIVSSLRHLSALHFGVFEFDRPKFLETLDLRHLNSLIVGESRKRNLDLSSLTTCVALERLSVDGRSKGIDSVRGLPSLEKITLRSATKDQSIAFLRAVPNLKDLTLVLGGRDDIADFASETLQTMQVVRVRGLKSLGDLSRFPSLRNLWIEDQPQLECLDLSGAQLERLALFNCKNLVSLVGLDQQVRLREFQSSRVALNVDNLRDFHWPDTTKAVRIFSGSLKWNELTAKALMERGYSQGFQDWR